MRTRDKLQRRNYPYSNRKRERKCVVKWKLSAFLKFDLFTGHRPWATSVIFHPCDHSSPPPPCGSVMEGVETTLGLWITLSRGADLYNNYLRKMGENRWLAHNGKST